MNVKLLKEVDDRLFCIPELISDVFQNIYKLSEKFRDRFSHIAEFIFQVCQRKVLHKFPELRALCIDKALDFSIGKRGVKFSERGSGFNKLDFCLVENFVYAIAEFYEISHCRNTQVDSKKMFKQSDELSKRGFRRGGDADEKGKRFGNLFSGDNSHCLTKPFEHVQADFHSTEQTVAYVSHKLQLRSR